MPTGNEAEPDAPDAPDTGQQDAPPSGGALATDVHPQYALTFLGTTLFYAGEKRVIKWAITATDGSDVGVPTAASLVITLHKTAIGVATLTPDVESTVATRTQLIGALWDLAGVSPGLYDVRFVVTLGADLQTWIDEAIVVVE